jgi:hypothetical protein
MAESSGGLWIMLAVLAWNSSLFESNTVTEYTEDNRCYIQPTNTLGNDVKTGRPVRKDENGKWQWYTPERSSELTCAEVNLKRTNYRAYGEAGKVTVWIDDGESKGYMTEYTGCVVGDAKNWRCNASDAMTGGVLDKDHRINWWKWQLNAAVAFFHSYEGRWFIPKCELANLQRGS